MYHTPCATLHAQGVTGKPWFLVVPRNGVAIGCVSRLCNVRSATTMQAVILWFVVHF